MPPVRSSHFFPALKCSTCGAEVEIAMMGDHVCQPKPKEEKPEEPPVPPIPAFPLLRQPPAQDSPVKAKGAKLPQIDSLAANRPFLGQLAPSAEEEDESPLSAREIPQRKNSLSPPLAAANPEPSPGNGGFFANSIHNNLYAPASPTANAGRNILERANGLAPGPFGVNNNKPPASPLANVQNNTRPNGYSNGQASLDSDSESEYEDNTTTTYGHRRQKTQDSFKYDYGRKQSIDRPSTSMSNRSFGSRRSESRSSMRRYRPEDNEVPAIPPMDRRREMEIEREREEERRRREEEERERERELEREREREEELERERIREREREERERLLELERERERDRVLEEERRREREREERLQRLQEEEQERIREKEAAEERSRELERKRSESLSRERERSRSRSAFGRRDQSSERGLPPHLQQRRGSPPTDPLPNPTRQPMGLPRRPSEKGTPAHTRNKSSVSTTSSSLRKALPPSPIPPSPPLEQSKPEALSIRRPSTSASNHRGSPERGRLGPGARNASPNNDRPRSRSPSRPGLAPPDRKFMGGYEEGYHMHSPSTSSEASSAFSRASQSTTYTDPSMTASPKPSFERTHKTTPSGGSLKDSVDNLLRDVKNTVENLLPTPLPSPAPRTPTYNTAGYKAYSPFSDPKSPRFGQFSPSLTSPNSKSPGPETNSAKAPESKPLKKAMTMPTGGRKEKPSCRGCNQEIHGKGLTSSDGRLTGRYHKHCFVCQHCRQPFSSSTFYVFENKPYCHRHYHELNNSLCSACDRGIEGRCTETEAGERFHLGCFSCSDCGVVLGEDYYEFRGRAFCERHAMSRMQMFQDQERMHQQQQQGYGMAPGGPRGGRPAPRGNPMRGGPGAMRGQRGGPGGGGYGMKLGPPGAISPRMDGGMQMGPGERMERRRTRIMMM